MALETAAEIEELKGRAGAEKTLTDGAEDISGGKEINVGDVSSVTLYLDAAAAVDVTVEFSPDGTNWYEPVVESPVSFTAAGTEIVHIDFNAAKLRVTGSNTTAVRAQTREVV